VADVIPFRRIKCILIEALATRFATVEKSPPKAREFRAARPPSRIAGRELDALYRLHSFKFVVRARKSPKLRLFRIFKLLGQLKSPIAAPAAYRPVAERLHLMRRLRRL
jgi:hypothetical protein